MRKNLVKLARERCDLRNQLTAQITQGRKLAEQAVSTGMLDLAERVYDTMVKIAYYAEQRGAD